MITPTTPLLGVHPHTSPRRSCEDKKNDTGKVMSRTIIFSLKATGKGGAKAIDRFIEEAKAHMYMVETAPNKEKKTRYEGALMLMQCDFSNALGG